MIIYGSKSHSYLVQLGKCCNILHTSCSFEIKTLLWWNFLNLQYCLYKTIYLSTRKCSQDSWCFPLTICTMHHKFLAQVACVRHAQLGHCYHHRSVLFWPRRLACAMRACMRHAQLGHCYYHRSVFLSCQAQFQQAIAIAIELSQPYFQFSVLSCLVLVDLHQI